MPLNVQQDLEYFTEMGFTEMSVPLEKLGFPTLLPKLRHAKGLLVKLHRFSCRVAVVHVDNNWNCRNQVAWGFLS